MKPTPPLSRSAPADVLDWEGVERAPAPRANDVLGLGPDDRAALGLSAARTVDLAPTIGGDAHAALVEALQKGAAVGKREPAARTRKLRR